MGTILSVASGKGGVGKTLVTAGLGVVLSRLGEKVLLVDGDMGLRDLDLVLGVQDEVLYDVVDVLKKRISPQQAIFSLAPCLDFLAASQKRLWEKVDAPSFHYLLEQMAQEYTYVIVDGPPGRGKAYQNATAVADLIIFVVAPSWMSLRDTQRVMQYCDKHRNFEYAVLYNNFYRDGANHISIGDMLAVLEPERIAGLLPHTETGSGAVLEGGFIALPDDEPFFQALGYTADYLRQEKDIDISALADLLPDSETALQQRVEQIRDREAKASREDIVPDSSLTVPVQGLSLRRRRLESASWRHPRR